jgi:hypothetical protein
MPSAAHPLLAVLLTRTAARIKKIPLWSGISGPKGIQTAIKLVLELNRENFPRKANHALHGHGLETVHFGNC